MERLKYDDYPQNCPPQQAAEIEGVFYRLCDEEIPIRTDFMTHFDSNLAYPEHMLCEAKALSFYDTLESAEKIKKRYKKKFKNKKIVKVVIEKKLGIGEINNNHLNLWEYFGLNIFDLVKVQFEEVS